MSNEGSKKKKKVVFNVFSIRKNNQKGYGTFARRRCHCITYSLHTCNWMYKSINYVPIVTHLIIVKSHKGSILYSYSSLQRKKRKLREFKYLPQSQWQSKNEIQKTKLLPLCPYQGLPSMAILGHAR